MGQTSKVRELVRTSGLAFAAEIAVNFILPYIIYSYAAPEFGDVRALLASSAPPILWSIVEFIRHRRMDAMSLLVLGGIILSLLAFFGGGGPRMLQLREKLVTGAVGLVFLISAAVGRPLMYEIAKAGMARKGSTETERMVTLRNEPRFKRSMTIMTLVWGFVLVLDVGIGAVLVFTLTIKEYLIVNPIQGYALLGGLGLWTFWYSKRSKIRNEMLRAADRSNPAGAVNGGD